MYLSHIPQCTIQNRNVHISILDGVLWDMGQVQCGFFLNLPIAVRPKKNAYGSPFVLYCRA